MRTLLPILFLAACTSPADDFRSVLPDDRLLLDTDGVSRQARGSGEPSDNAVETFGTAQGINDLLGEVLGTIEEVTSYPPSWQATERVATWGPWTDNGIDGRLWVRERRDGSYGWAFEFRFEGEGDDLWQAPIAGEIDAGASDAASTGSMVIDAVVFDTFAEDVGAQGYAAIEYAIDGEGASGNLALDDFAEESGDPLADAVMAWTTTEDDGGSLEFVAVSDVSEPQNGSAETLAIYSRWLGDGTGRSDAAITGGDAGDLTFYETDCWDAALTTTFYENSYELRREGDKASCAFADPE